MKNFYPVLLSVIFCCQFSTAQSGSEELKGQLKTYHSIPKEVAYLHLNKSVLLQGEHLGFSAYVVNKNDLNPSKETTNLYVQVKNESGEVVTEKVLLVENGVASNSLEIDSTFTFGNYSITAFTNWMRNFKEQNFFTESFRVLQTNIDYQPIKTVWQGLDLQFLPESGHLLKGVVNNVGIVAKDQTGYGLSNATVVVRDSKGHDIATIKLNRFGIGRFSMVPHSQENYTAVVLQEGTEVPVGFDLSVEQEGIILSATQRGDELRLLATTNAASHSKMQKKPLILAIQNRNTVDAYEVGFSRSLSIPIVIDLQTLASGINIITLFDEDHNPIAERLIFNHHDLPIMEMPKAQITSLQDSLQIKFPVHDQEKINFSVSILPQNSVSATRHHNIISYNLLQPYVRGMIENAGWYFQDSSEDRKFELDNLLLTQGWSSYDWVDIFNSELELKYNFEKNFEVKAIINNKDVDNKNLRYLIHATINNNPLVAEIPLEKEAFVFDEFRPVEGEPIYISRIKNNDKLVPAGLVLQSYPQKIPELYIEPNLLPQRSVSTFSSGNRLKQVTAYGEEIEELGEVLLEAQKRNEVLERERKLGENSYGKAHVVQLTDVNLYGTLANYLRSKGLKVSEQGGNFSATTIMGAARGFMKRGVVGVEIPGMEKEEGENLTETRNTIEPEISQAVAFYLDGMLLYDLSTLYQYPLSSIDYIEINQTGMGNGFVGNAGHVKIYTDFRSSKIPQLSRNRIQRFKLPLAYSVKKTFYVPGYESTSDDFFVKFGVIDWKPDLQSKDGEEVTFKIKKPEVDYQIITEGFTDDGRFIYEVENFSVKNSL